MNILKIVKILTIIPCLFISISFFNPSFADDKNNQSIKVVSLDQEFIQYVPETKLTICDGLGDTCKKFYIGFYLSKEESNTSLALKYLLAAYESGIENILIDEPEARDIYLTMTIGSLYRRKNDLDNAIKYWKKAYDDDRYGSIENANMALYYEQTNDNKKYKFTYLKLRKQAAAML